MTHQEAVGRLKEQYNKEAAKIVREQAFGPLWALEHKTEKPPSDGTTEGK